MSMRRVLEDIAAAFQFLTWLPLTRLGHEPAALSRAAKYFPVVGIVIGLLAALIFHSLLAHLPAALAALFTVLFSVLATGGLHEDGLADAADAFGGGWNRDQVLEILKDSRIGSFGALALVFSVSVRTFLLANLPANLIGRYMVVAHVLCRWTALPLGFLLPPARNNDGQGARIARQISAYSLSVGTFLAFGLAVYLLRAATWAPLVAASIVTALSGWYYQRRIGGVTGDCFGATIQLAEIVVYLCGVWHR